MNRGNNMPGKTIKRAIAFVMIAATVFSISAVDYQVGNYRLRHQRSKRKIQSFL
jgi:hypothetical protein